MSPTYNAVNLSQVQQRTACVVDVATQRAGREIRRWHGKGKPAITQILGFAAIEKVCAVTCYLTRKFIILESCGKKVIKFNCYKYSSSSLTSSGLALKVRLPSSSCMYSFLKENPRGGFLLYMEQWPQVDLHNLQKVKSDKGTLPYLISRVKCA